MGRWRVAIQVGEENPSDPVEHSGGTSQPGPKNGSSAGSSHRYEVGPGFEIAVRSDAANPVAFTLRKEGDGDRPPSKSGGSDHRFESIEKRLESLERALLLVVDQMKRIEDRRPK